MTSVGEFPLGGTMRRSALLPLALLLAAVACAPKAAIRSDSKTASAAGAGASGTVVGASGAADAGVAPGVDVQESSVRGKQYASAADLKMIPFDYDAHQLSASARETLRTVGTFRTIDVADVLRAAIDTVVPAMAAKRITFETEFDPNTPPIVADPDREVARAVDHGQDPDLGSDPEEVIGVGRRSI